MKFMVTDAATPSGRKGCIRPPCPDMAADCRGNPHLCIPPLRGRPGNEQVRTFPGCSQPRRGRGGLSWLGRRAPWDGLLARPAALSSQPPSPSRSRHLR